MPFVTKILLSSGDRSVLSDTIEGIKTTLKQRGAEHYGPHVQPTETVNVPQYQQLRSGQEFSSWSYSVYKQSLEIHGSNDIVRDVVARNFPDSLHVEVEVGKDGDKRDKINQGDSKSADSQDATQVEGVKKSTSLKEDVEQSDVDGSTDQNISPKADIKDSTTDEEGVCKENQRSDTEDSRSTPKLDTDLEKLREQAIEDAVESVPDNSITATQTTRQYNRSKVVRDYVMSRAGGQCEACGEPAPFTSKTGEPYLHGHHIDELSDGGSDKPESVIALCPNCHYRVHHGEDGNEYNQRLKTRVEKIESHLDD